MAAALGVPVPRAYFHLNLAFADTAAQATGVGLPEALRRWTNVYLRLRLGESFDADDPVWRAYVARLPEAADRVDLTYELYLARREAVLPPPPAPAPGTRVGCFRCELWDEGRLRLHFEDRDDSPHGPLSHQRVEVRRAELGRLFAWVRQHLPEVRAVVGGSWLYNIDAYRRLFPPAYLATAYPAGEAELRYYSLWGQFLDRHGEVKQEMAAPFLERLGGGPFADINAVAGCLPYQVLRLEAPVACFYDHFGR